VSGDLVSVSVRLARRALPFALGGLALFAGLLLASVLRHRRRLRLGRVSGPRRRTRIAPLP